MPKETHAGRLIDHLHLISHDLPASKRFYAAVFEALGRSIEGERDDMFWSDEFNVSTPEPGVTTAPTHIHLAFQASDRAMVDRFHAAGLAAGGRDNGAPGVRRYHEAYYGAFLLDPDGNNVEVVHHGPTTRSADAVRITFDRR